MHAPMKTNNYCLVILYQWPISKIQTEVRWNYFCMRCITDLDATRMLYNIHRHVKKPPLPNLHVLIRIIVNYPNGYSHEYSRGTCFQVPKRGPRKLAALTDAKLAMQMTSRGVWQFLNYIQIGSPLGACRASILEHNLSFIPRDSSSTTLPVPYRENVLFLYSSLRIFTCDNPFLADPLT